jgi:hypothetical protein
MSGSLLTTLYIMLGSLASFFEVAGNRNAFGLLHIINYCFFEVRRGKENWR